MLADGVRRLGGDLEVELFGPKAATLGVLVSCGFAIPDGIVISRDVAIALVRAAAEDMGGVLGYLANQLQEAEAHASWAVRSSCLLEDGVSVSAAGQFVTVLDIPWGSGIVSGIFQCLEGPTTVASSGMRFDGGIIVQAMVPNVVLSGVLFTDAAGIEIEYSEMSTSAVTGGFDRPARASFDLELNNVGGADPANSWILEGVARVGLGVRHALGYECDVEWTVVGDQIFVLQARPVTRLRVTDTLSSMAKWLAE